jgi:hypothetical protein
MVLHYQPGRVRSNSDQPTAITNVLVATSGSSYHAGDIPAGHPDLLGLQPPGPLGAVPQRRRGRGHVARRCSGRTSGRGRR